MSMDGSNHSGSDRDARPPQQRTGVTARRLRQAKAAYTTRFVSRLIASDSAGFGLLSGDGVAPNAGDVVLAMVEAIGQHKGIELPDGRRATLFKGDEVLVAYGNRYAPDQFEAEVPDNLGMTSLVAAGGVAASVLSSHSSMLPPTALRPVGLLAQGQGVVTLRRVAPYRVDEEQSLPGRGQRPFTIGVLGTSMNSGKTTTAAALVRGLTAAGLDVAAGKVTGTGAGGDPSLFVDSGATRVLDFTDFGHPSTYRVSNDEIRALLIALHAEMARVKPQVIVLEIADGILQQETARLIRDPVFGQHVDSVVFTAREAMGAMAGTALLRRHGIRVAAVSGVLTASPLAAREAREALVPVLSAGQLADPTSVRFLLPASVQNALMMMADAAAAV